jgi:hypothetical protein
MSIRKMHSKHPGGDSFPGSGDALWQDREKRSSKMQIDAINGH